MSNDLFTVSVPVNIYLKKLLASGFVSQTAIISRILLFLVPGGHLCTLLIPRQLKYKAVFIISLCLGVLAVCEIACS